MESLSVISKNDLVEIVKRVYETINEKKDYLSKLDTEIGERQVEELLNRINHGIFS